MKATSLKGLKWEKRFTYVKNVVFDGKDLHRPGARFQIVRFKKGRRIAPHYHKQTTEIFYVRSGRGTVTLKGKRFKAEKDDIFLVEPLDVHEIENKGKNDLVILIFKSFEGRNDIFWKK